MKPADIASLNDAANTIEDFSNRVKTLSDKFKNTAIAHHRLVHGSPPHYGEIGLVANVGGRQNYNITNPLLLEKIKDLVIEDMVNVMVQSREQLEALIKEAKV